MPIKLDLLPLVINALHQSKVQMTPLALGTTGYVDIITQ